MVFKNREDAGRQLAEHLEQRDLDIDLVLAIPRGGLPVGRQVADHLKVPLDVVVASKIGAPGNPELAIGAAASDGSYWLDEELIGRLEADREYVEQERKKESENARQKLEFMRGTGGLPDVQGKTVAVVDDGIATGSTARACTRQLEDAGAEKVILAVPVGPAKAATELEKEVDEVVIMDTPHHFGAVGAFYQNFEQVTDEEAREYLKPR